MPFDRLLADMTLQCGHRLVLFAREYDDGSYELHYDAHCPDGEKLAVEVTAEIYPELQPRFTGEWERSYHGPRKP